MLGAFLMASACSEPLDPRRTNFEVRRDNVYAKYDPKSGRLKKLDADIDKDGRMDAFSYWEGARLLYIEIDKDEDGVIERWEHYDESNKLVKIGGSTKRDGIEDSWDFVDGEGLHIKSELDADRDGVIETRYLYGPYPGQPTRRVMLEAHLNLDVSGQPASKVYYRPDGTTERTEVIRP